MRQLIISLLTFVFFSSHAQTEKTKIFKRTEYFKGVFYRQLLDTVEFSDEKIDVYFFKRHFFSPYYLPDKFVDKRYKNIKVSVWANPKGKKDYHANWENTYTYDSLCRVTDFSYSGCVVCNNIAYDFKVKYDNDGRAIQIMNSTGAKNGFKFFYDKEGGIDRLEQYLFGKLETIITLVN